MMRSFTVLVIVGAVVGFLYLVSPVEPVIWQPDPKQDLTGPYARKNSLDSAVQLEIDGEGPEDLLFDEEGNILTGLEDGRIIKILAPHYTEQITFANTGGRPLGLRFDNQNQLVIADAVKGLIRFNFTTGTFETLANSFDGKPMLLVDHLDIAANGDIYFSDASARFGMDDFVLDFVEASFSGRIFRYAAASQTVELLVDGLFFANGVALGANDAYLLINETGTARILKFHLSGDKAGQQEIFLSSLPGLPDNIFFDENGVFWVGIITLRDWRVESLANSVFLRKLIANVPQSLLERSAPYGMVIGVAENGRIVANLQSDKSVAGITAAVPFKDKLFLGFLKGSRIAYLSKPSFTQF